jgi:Holliday junction resolvasome RuvABC endonuclease subunit
MNGQGHFPFGSYALGVDPGSSVVGVCFLGPDGNAIGMWSLEAKGEPERRLEKLHTLIMYLFESVEVFLKKEQNQEVQVFVEEGLIFDRPNASKVSKMQGEVRGIVCGDAWRRGWNVTRVHVQSWKAMLTKEQKAMPKDKAYVKYWNGRLGTKAKKPDEIDAYFIAKRGAMM